MQSNNYVTETSMEEALASKEYATKSDLSSLSTGISEPVLLYQGKLTTGNTANVSGISAYKYILFIRLNDDGSPYWCANGIISVSDFKKGEVLLVDGSGTYFRYNSETTIYVEKGYSAGMYFRIYGVK